MQPERNYSSIKTYGVIVVFRLRPVVQWPMLPRVDIIGLVRKPTGEPLVSLKIVLMIRPVPARRRSILERLDVVTRGEVSVFFNLLSLEGVRKGSESLSLGLRIVRHNKNVGKKRGDKDIAL